MKSIVSRRVAAAFLAWGAIAMAAASHASERTEAFAETAIETIGAESVRCSREVRAAVRSRQMVAVCARFDGDFELFRSRWAERLELSAGGGGAPTLPEAAPRTRWEERDGIYERIYAVGQTAVGVRFSRGDLMLVFSE